MYIDDNFLIKIKEAEKELRERFQKPYLDRIRLNEIIRISYYIDDLKPKSKYREYKYALINYLEAIRQNDRQIKEPQLSLLKNRYLQELAANLVEKHGFYRKNVTIYSNLIYGFVLDIFCWILGLSKNYFYFPFFTFLSLIFFLIRRMKKVKENKFLRI